MSDERDATDAKIAAAEAPLRGEANEKFARIEGRIDTLAAELSGKINEVLSAVRRAADRADSKSATLEKGQFDLERKLAEHRADYKADFCANRTLMIGLAVSVAGLLIAVVLAVFTVGGTMFSRGMSVRDVVTATTAEVLQQQQSTPLTGKSP